MLLKFQSCRLIRRGFCAEAAVLLRSGVFGGSREGLTQTHNPRNTWVWWNPLPNSQTDKIRPPERSQRTHVRIVNGLEVFSLKWHSADELGKKERDGPTTDQTSLLIMFWYNLVRQLHHNIRISHPSGGSNAVTAAHITRIYAYKGLNSTCKCIFWKTILFLRHTTPIEKLELVLFSAAEHRWQKKVSSAGNVTSSEKRWWEGFVPPKQSFVFRFI